MTERSIVAKIRADVTGYVSGMKQAKAATDQVGDSAKQTEGKTSGAFGKLSSRAQGEVESRHESDGEVVQWPLLVVVPSAQPRHPARFDARLDEDPFGPLDLGAEVALVQFPPCAAAHQFSEEAQPGRVALPLAGEALFVCGRQNDDREPGFEAFDVVVETPTAAGLTEDAEVCGHRAARAGHDNRPRRRISRRTKAQKVVAVLLWRRLMGPVMGSPG